MWPHRKRFERPVVQLKVVWEVTNNTICSGNDKKSWSLAEAHANDGNICRRPNMQEIWRAGRDS